MSPIPVELDKEMAQMNLESPQETLTSIEYEEALKETSLFNCEECHYVGMNAKNLRRHVESKHLGVRYPCERCEYVATT